MKKFIFSLIFVLVALTANAQSFQYHQGYDFKNNVSSQKFIADYFWSNDNWNVFSWNNFGVNYDANTPGSTDATALLYVERKIGNTDFYVHPEVRLNTWCENYYQLGIAYLLPLDDSFAIYLTPKYSYHNRHDFQFSINSSYENVYFYHEGYFDSDWVNPVENVTYSPGPIFGIGGEVVKERKNFVGFFAEEKFYWKATENFHFGVNLMFGGDTMNGITCFAPMFVARVSLY